MECFPAARSASDPSGVSKAKGITGRGRCAAEGLNCTLTGTAEGIRAFAQGLRDWDPIFNETDFKFTDGLDYSKRFKSLTIQKKAELVAYGLPVTLAPSLKERACSHRHVGTPGVASSGEALLKVDQKGPKKGPEVSRERRPSFLRKRPQRGRI